MKIVEIEKKWQKIWDDKKVFASFVDHTKPKYYVLEMLPYPSGKIHVGHLRNYTIGDVCSRFLKAKGYNVLHPMGFDAFGLPAENAAIANKTHPANWTYKNIENMTTQLKAIGLSYDWSRNLNTCDPEYYKHEQKFFLELLDKGLAYQKESIVSWDPVDQTVLANEQVIDGRGWRSGALVERKSLKQWFLKITNYAEELLNEIKTLDGWPESVKAMQEKWIGKSEGVNISFQVVGHDFTIPVFTTCPDTLFGASFVGISYNHPLIQKIQKTPFIQAFIDKCSKMSVSTTELDKAEKEGIDTGLKVYHPFDNTIHIPVIIANFVLMEYGTGAVYGCPGHDERDHELALKMGYNIHQVVQNDAIDINISRAAYTGEGVMINSGFLNGLDRTQAKKLATKKLEELGIGQAVINYRLKDWGISRQRFWGCPIPIIYCNSCGIVPVHYQDLPVELPKDVIFDGKGNPLDHHPTWKHTKCPKCKANAIRETDTFDTFFESSWYFARYCDPKAENMTGSECNYWMPVDQYIGGIEHAVMHLLYARFFTKVMQESGYVNVREPFKNLLTQGMVLHATYKNAKGEWLYPKEALELQKRGETVFVGSVEKMSKSKNNVVDLESMLSEYGADTARMFVLSDSPPERDLEWSDSGIEGCNKFINRLFSILDKIKDTKASKEADYQNDKAMKAIHSTIKEVTEDIEHFRLNKAIARIRELTNTLSTVEDKLLRYGFEMIIRLLNPFIPHVTEEMWSVLGHTNILATEAWPTYKKDYLISDTVTIAIQINGKLRATHEYPTAATEEEIKSIALSLPAITKHTSGYQIKKVIVVKGKVVNIVIG